jgi:hypothetical protein
MPFDSNLGDAHIISDFGVGVTGSVRKVDLSGPPAEGVQKDHELPQTLLAIEDVDFSILWPIFQESMATGARKCRGQLLEPGI